MEESLGDTIYNDGYDSYSRTENIENPYPKGSEQYEIWEWGYDDAMSEDTPFCAFQD